MSVAIVLDRLKYRLISRGLTHVEVMRLIKDTVNIVGDSEKSNLFAINEKLHDLGWPHEILDARGLELIVFFKEIEESSDRGVLHSSPAKTKQGLHTVFVG